MSGEALTYHEAEIVSAALVALGHDPELIKVGDDAWKVTLRCGCGPVGRDSPCPA